MRDIHLLIVGVDVEFSVDLEQPDLVVLAARE